MSGESECVGPAAKPTSVFATTHWSIVRTARSADAPEAAAALERLCQTYWYPIYAHAMSAIRAVPSQEAVAIARESGLNTMVGIVAVCPRRGRTR